MLYTCDCGFTFVADQYIYYDGSVEVCQCPECHAEWELDDSEE